MKKIFSLVALVGMFALMSFKTLAPSPTETAAPNCQDVANEAAEIWMACTGGSFEGSMSVYYAAYGRCSRIEAM